MASSSGKKASSSRSIKTCSNEFCGEPVSRPRRKSGDREVDLCYQCLRVRENSQIMMGSRGEEIQDRPEESRQVKPIPLFEKVLTASDTGKSTWLVLPKNCAENFFQPINDQESMKVVCQDIDGEEWRFTLRSSTNNKGRTYVLDEFDLYAQDMELSQGDTVTFSRSESERKLIIGHRKNSSKSASNHLPRAVIASTSRVRDTRVTSRKKHKMSHDDTPNEAQEPLASDHGGNGLFVSVSERVKMKRQKDKAETSTHKRNSKGKYSLPTVANICKGKAIDSTSRGAKGKHIKTGFASRSADKKIKISAALKESTELEWSPRALRNSKGKAVERNSTPAPKKVRSVAKKIKNIALKTIASSKRTKTRNREPERQATVEARVGPNRKHPRHRTGCQCIICIQPPCGSKHSPTCPCRACGVKRRRMKTITEKAIQKPPTRRQRRVLEPAEPSNQTTITVRSGSEENQNEGREVSQSARPSNNQQNIRVNCDSEENRNDQSLTGSHSNNTIRRLFDLNLPPSDDDDDDCMDPTHQ